LEPDKTGERLTGVIEQRIPPVDEGHDSMVQNYW
jgi:hypothetical protein